MAEMRTIRTMAETDILERFGERLRQLRKDCGWSQEQLAEASGLDRSYMGGVERGERNIALRNIEALANALEISLSELMDGL
jgi:transcriptional regulator with XRE-family HTH domain